MAAFVRVSGPPNENFLVGYPGISATSPRIVGTVEVRPSLGISAPVNVSLVTICLQRRETIHPSADSMTKKHLATPRKELIDIVGSEVMLYRCPPGREYDEVISMDLPFRISIPLGRGGQEMARRVPPASLTLPHRTAETFYELVVTVQQGPSEQKKYPFPVPISRYDTLSTFGMYNRPESCEKVSDHLVTLGISLPRWSYGPLDPVSVYIKISPNPDWLSKAKRVTIQKITISIDEEVIYNHEGDEPYRKSKTLVKRTENVGIRMPEAGYFTNLGLVFPAKDLRDSEGILPRGKPAFPMYAVSGFTTAGSLYKIEYYLTVKAHMTSAKDIVLRQPIVVCPLDHAGCKDEMEAIEIAARDANEMSKRGGFDAVDGADGTNPNSTTWGLSRPTVVKVNDANALKYLGMAIVGNVRKPLIE